MSKKITHNDFLKRARLIHGDLYEYPDPYVKMNIPVKIICPQHGTYYQQPKHHLNGSKCYECNGVVRFSHTSFINRAKLTHGDRYRYPMIATGLRDRVTIVCDIHGDFTQTPETHLAGHGCPKCGINVVSTSNRLTHSQFVSKAGEVHGDRYEYPDEYISAHTKMQILCKKHGPFYQTPNNHVNCKHGCPKCGLEDVKKQLTLTHSQFVSKARDVHGDRYEYPEEYVNNQIPITIICKIHGLFKQIPNNHTCGKQGCPKCGLENAVKLGTMTNDDFLKRARIVHGDRYEYPDEYTGINNKIQIICKIHGLFVQTPNHHLNGRNGCPKCSHRISQPANDWLDSLGIPNDIEHREVFGLVSNKRYSVDGYDPDTKTVYEFHGDYYHGNPDKFDQDDINPTVGKSFGQLYENTIKKKNMFTDAGFDYIEMWESDWNNHMNSPVTMGGAKQINS